MRRFGNLAASTALMGVVRMTPSERKMGRFMRAPEGHEDGNGGASGNNGGENANPNGNGNQDGNNTGQEFEPRAFWEDPVEETAPNGNQPNGNGNPNGNQNQSGQEGNAGDDLGKAISTKVSQFTPPAAMTKEAIEAIGEGNYDKFNENFTNAIRGSMEQTIGTMVQLMGKFGEHMESKFQSLIDNSHTQRDSKSFLREQIPASKNEAIAPVVDALYERAMTLTKGNRQKAVDMTKRMMRAMSEGTAADLELNVAPIGSDSDPAPAKTNWLEALNMS